MTDAELRENVSPSSHGLRNDYAKLHVPNGWRALLADYVQ